MKQIAFGSAAAFGAFLLCAPVAHSASYPAMAPVDLYMMDHDAEIALARSAAPPSISNDAGVLVLGAHGFETAVTGTNGFVCMVERTWDRAFDDPEFWNPKTRGPVCLNPASARTVLPMLMERAEWAMSGLSKDEMEQRSRTSSKANTTPAAGAMSLMLSKEQYLSDTNPQWYPHVMFFSPKVDVSAWGANLKGSPVLGAPGSSTITMFFIPVQKWSDGTPAPAM
jgi:hypothetical protein